MMCFVWKITYYIFSNSVNWKSLDTVSNPVSLYPPSTQIIMFFKCHFFWKKSESSEKWLIPDLGQEI